MTTKTIHELASEAAAYLVARSRADGRYLAERTRPDGTTYIACRDDAPDWVRAMVHAAHGGMLPDDYRYQVIREALSVISDADPGADLDELADEFADDTDVYSVDLIAWLGSDQFRVGYVDDAIESTGSITDIMAAIRLGQALERREVFSTVAQYLQEEGA